MRIHRQRQRGAIAIMVGLTLVILVGMLALVVDLGHDYLVKTGLQNGADAAALAGANALNGKKRGVDLAVQQAVKMARQNDYAFGNQVGTTDADGGLDMYVGTCPDDGCMQAVSAVTSEALAAGMTFFKVDTRTRSMSTWFAGVLGITSMGTSAVAVAGHYVVDISPLGICQQLPGDPKNPVPPELGFERGVAYKVSEANPFGPGNKFYIDPVATAPGMCLKNTSDVLPFVCTGKITFTPKIGDTVYTVSGYKDPLLEALDSRFDVFNTTNKCDPATAPPDSNIKEYRYDAIGLGSPSSWMGAPPLPNRQSVRFTPSPCSPVCLPELWSTRPFGDYGVLWSAYRPAGPESANATTDPAISKLWNDWYNKYPPVPVPPPVAVNGYPQPSPYAQTNPNYFKAPTHSAQPGRRVLNMAILDCKDKSEINGTCNAAIVVGIGKFFMQRKANVPTDKDIYVEFGGLLSTPFPPSDNRLYR